jgi:hypothetical protein
MKKTIFPVPLLIVCLYLLLTLISCNKENPVEPPPPVTVDSSDQYLWTDIGFGDMIRAYAADTNRIYLFYLFNTYVADGYAYNRVYFANPQFIAEDAMNSPDGSTYFLGFNYRNPRLYPAIEKLQNGIFTETYEASADTNNSGFQSMTFEDENNAWLTIGNGCSSFYHFSSGIFKEYKLDTNLLNIYIFKQNNIIYLFGNKILWNYPSSFTLNSYIYQNNDFELLSIDTMPEQAYLKPMLIFQTSNNDLILNGKNVLKYFNGRNWIILIPQPFDIIWEIGGYSKDSLIVLAKPFLEYTSVYTWNGKFWNGEDSANGIIRRNVIHFDNSGGPLNIKMLYNKVFIPVTDNQNSRVLIGQKKKKIKNQN